MLRRFTLPTTRAMHSSSAVVLGSSSLFCFESVRWCTGTGPDKSNNNNNNNNNSSGQSVATNITTTTATRSTSTPDADDATASASPQEQQPPPATSTSTTATTAKARSNKTTNINNNPPPSREAIAAAAATAAAAAPSSKTTAAAKEAMKRYTGTTAQQTPEAKAAKKARLSKFKFGRDGSTGAATPGVAGGSSSNKAQQQQQQQQHVPPGMASGFANASRFASAPSARGGGGGRSSGSNTRRSSSSSSSPPSPSASSAVGTGVVSAKAANIYKIQPGSPMYKKLSRGRLRSRSPSMTPAAARTAAANLRSFREAAQRLKEAKKNRPDYETGDNVKGLWGIYLRFLHQRGVFAVFVTSVTLWAIGDTVSQLIELQLVRSKDDVTSAVDEVECFADGSTELPRFKWGRFFGALIDGSLIAGVGGHFWYQALDKFVSRTCLLRRGTLSFVATKMLCEFCVWHPLNLVTFWMVVGFAEGDGFWDIMREFRDDFLPTLAGEYALWGPLDLMMFAIVPAHLQVIVSNCGCLVESVFLSYVRSQGFPGFPAPDFGDSLEDRGMPISIIDVLRQTDVSFERALRDGVERFIELDVDGKGYLVAEDIKRYLGEQLVEDALSDKLLPGIPCPRATAASAEILIRHMAKKGQLSRREYLRFIGELNHASYRTSRMPEVAFTLFDTTERHFITGSSLIELAHLLHETPEGKQTVKLMMPALEALRSKELTVDEASAVLGGLDTLSKFHKGESSDTNQQQTGSSNNNDSNTKNNNKNNGEEGKKQSSGWW